MISWILGFMGLPGIVEQVLKIVNTSLGIVSPALTSVFELIVWYVKVLWNGVLDIVDSWMTILTVMTIVLGTWAYGKLPTNDPRLSQCQAQLETLKKRLAPRQQAPQVEFKWPWEWLF